MTTTISVQPAAPEEWGAALAVTRAAYAEYAEKSEKEFWNSYERSIEKTLLTDESVTRIVAKVDSTVVAAVVYCPPYERRMGPSIVKNPYPEIRLLAVPPEHRSKGIAGKLIDYCENKAAASGASKITLHTTVLMQTAKQMYERRGYVRYEEIDFEPVPGFIVWGYQKDI